MTQGEERKNTKEALEATHLSPTRIETVEDLLVCTLEVTVMENLEMPVIQEMTTEVSRDIQDSLDTQEDLRCSKMENK